MLSILKADVCHADAEFAVDDRLANLQLEFMLLCARGSIAQLHDIT